MEGVKHKAAVAAEERLLDALLPPERRKLSTPFALFQDSSDTIDGEILSDDHKEDTFQSTREKLRIKLQEGKLEEFFGGNRS